MSTPERMDVEAIGKILRVHKSCSCSHDSVARIIVDRHDADVAGLRERLFAAQQAVLSEGLAHAALRQRVEALERLLRQATCTCSTGQCYFCIDRRALLARLAPPEGQEAPR